jgi:2'-5' RNA ligase
VALAIIAEPRFAPADRAWIEAIRARHDPQAALVAPHITLVFPAPVRRLAMPLRHLRSAARDEPPFAIRLNAALAVSDASGNYVFLVPDQGARRLIRLHERLYAGPLRRHRRRDIRFIPHLTVARCATRAAAEALAERLNARAFAIRSRIIALQAIELAAGRVRPVAALALRPPRRLPARAAASAPGAPAPRPARSSPPRRGIPRASRPTRH